jgi:hypothetical protein
MYWYDFYQKHSVFSNKKTYEACNRQLYKTTYYMSIHVR